MSDKKPQKVAVQLEFPVDLPDGTVLAEITIRRPRAKDAAVVEEASGQGETAQGLAMLACLTGLSVDVISELDLDDFTKASEVVADFFPQSQG